MSINNMQYIFTFRYKPETELNILNNFIKLRKMKWKRRIVHVNGDVISQFMYSGDFIYDQDIEDTEFKKIKNSGVYIDLIEQDNGRIITPVFLQNKPK
jgi:hypothetical protein